MVVEHVFITTREWLDVSAAVTEMLGRRGFTTDASAGFAIDPNAPGVLAMSRGKKALKGLLPRISPLKLRMTFDRGRVDLALAMDDVASRSAFRIGGNRKRRRNRENYLIAISSGIEESITGKMSVPEADAFLASADDEVRAKQRRETVISYGVLAAFLVIVVAIILIAIILAATAR